MNGWKLNNGDINISSRGIEMVKGSDKISQDLANWLTNDLGYNRFHPQMGASLDQFIPQAVSASQQHEIRQRVRDSMRRYMNMQLQEVQERIAMFGGDLAGVGFSGPSGIVKNFDNVEIGRYYDRIVVRVTFTTFTDTVSGITLAIG